MTNSKLVTEKEIKEFFKTLGFNFSDTYSLSDTKNSLNISVNNWRESWKLSARTIKLIADFFETWNFEIHIEANEFERSDINLTIEFSVLKLYVDLKEEENEENYY